MKSIARIGSALIISGALILISWVTSPFARTPPPAVAPSGADVDRIEQATQSLAPLTTEVDSQAARLRARLSQPPPKPEPSRNPFTFKGTHPISTEKAEKGTYPKTPISVENRYVPVLVAITGDPADGGLMRTAVLSMNDEMKIVRPGQMFDRFIVEAIGPDAVRIVDITSPTRATFTIAIR